MSHPREGTDPGSEAPTPREPSNVPAPSTANTSYTRGGWMERLEAVRKSTAEVARKRKQQIAEPPPPDDGPEELERSGPPELPPKPAAHQLLAQLEQAFPSPSVPDVEPEPTGMGEISSAHIHVELEEAPPSGRRWRDVLLVSLIVVSALGVLAGAYSSARRAPVPEVNVDPELAQKKERMEQALAALERGHRYALEGKASADKAIRAYRKALAAVPELAAAERGLAIAYTAKGQRRKAATHYRRYLRLEPEAHDAEDVRAILTKWRRSRAN